MRRGAAALLLLAAMACHARKERSAAPAPVSAQTLYARGRTAILRGNYLAAELIAKQGEQRFAAQAYWHQLFTVLEAESFAKRDAKRALRLLEQTPAAGTSLPAVRHLMTQAALLPAKANEILSSADDLAARCCPELRPEIAARRSAVLFRLKKDADAKQCAEKAIETGMAAKQMPALAMAYGSLGYHAANDGRWAEGIDYYTKASKYADAAQAPPLQLAANANLGWCYLDSGDPDRALQLLMPALTAARQQSNTYYEHIASVHIAEAHVRRMEYDQALPYANAAFAIAKRGADRAALANSYHQLGSIEFRLGNYDAAKKWNDQALKTRQNDPKGVLVDLVDKARILDATGNPAAALEILNQVLESKGLEPATRWRVQGYEAGIYARLGHLAEAQQMYEATLKTGVEAREKVQGKEPLLSFERNFLSFYDGYIDMLRQSGRIAEALEVAERSRARTLREAVGIKTGLSVDPVRLARAKNATILVYWVGARRSLLWTITPQGIKLAPLPADEEIDRTVDAYLTELQSTRHSLRRSTLGPKLYAMLVAPAKIAPQSRVIILPDAHLTALNFETLIAPAPQPHYWIDDVTVSYSPSLHLLASTPAWKGMSDARLLAVGNIPDAGRSFPWLRKSGLEISNVAQHFDSSRCVILSGPAATPASYAAARPETFDYIHFAAHATASTAAPLESAVILAPDAHGIQLRGSDIVNRRLAAELVTISSCNSAGRRSYAGEGLVGLAWAFLGAGARRVVAAQWNVSDSAAPGLMESMYAAIRNGVEPAEALRRAKLSLLHSENVDEIHKQPLYWAPFVIYGGP
ncbi:MAG TPA: CHAT domain-containing tetratricopeptide repeat protein [Thermoanaerobaculia bacterium]|jgi:CHAT domain-containing protein